MKNLQTKGFAANLSPASIPGRTLLPRKCSTEYYNMFSAILHQILQSSESVGNQSGTCRGPGRNLPEIRTETCRGPGPESVGTRIEICREAGLQKIQAAVPEIFKSSRTAASACVIRDKNFDAGRSGSFHTSLSETAPVSLHHIFLSVFSFLSLFSLLSRSLAGPRSGPAWSGRSVGSGCCVPC